MRLEQPERLRLSQAKAVVVGLGNIGGHLVQCLIRAGVGKLVLIDRDKVEAGNTNQIYTPWDVGRAKAQACAEHLRRRDPQAEIWPIVADIEEMGLGQFRADVLVSALDSRRGRQVLNEIAWRLGIPLVDAAVGPEMDGRVNVYLPGPDIPGPDTSPCIECSWSDIDYELVEAAYPCRGDREAAPTSAVSDFVTGGLIGALEAAEVVKLLLGKWEKVAVGREIYLNALHHVFRATRILRNPTCRFDHQIWKIEPLGKGADQITAGELLDLLEERCGRGLQLRFRRPFVGRVICRRCGTAHAVYRAVLRLQDLCRLCRCGGELRATALDLIDAWTREDMAPFAGKRLSELGLPERDVVAARRGEQELYFELA